MAETWRDEYKLSASTARSTGVRTSGGGWVTTLEDGLEYRSLHAALLAADMLTLQAGIMPETYFGDLNYSYECRRGGGGGAMEVRRVVGPGLKGTWRR